MTDKLNPLALLQQQSEDLKRHIVSIDAGVESSVLALRKRDIGLASGLKQVNQKLATLVKENEALKTENVKLAARLTHIEKWIMQRFTKRPGDAPVTPRPVAPVTPAAQVTKFVKPEVVEPEESDYADEDTH